MRSTRTRLAPLAAAALVGLPVAAAAPAMADHEGTEMMAELSQLNDSGASGTAWGVFEDDGMLTIQLQTQGLLDGAPHAQHIHIGGANQCPDPGMEGSGPNGEIRTTDAADDYGAVQVSLTTEPGMTGGDHALDVANFPAQGSYSYERTFEVPDDVASDIAAGKGVIVVHGADHNGSGEYDGDQESDLDPSLPSEATDPALCGEFQVAQTSMPDGGVATGGAGTSGAEHTGLIAMGAATLAAGALGLAAVRRRQITGDQS
ncbi:CHRD domain-containing protein [Ornithinicoccus halotolerans]|uniref:CHRD domain-containing protein n=1 Tax=Ornithinicoccus halotolerans TaxID=1748220 RepID=UPI001294CC28|nr:CHRD domain-containing protein [Ornithinicoccus halotolerans]